jgi:hypothetical protein
MRRFAFVCCVVTLTHGLLGADRAATAASITSISYDITGGNFGSLFPNLMGPITGISVTYTPPGGSISTDPRTYCSGTYACGRLDFVITGPSATTTFLNYPAFVSISPNYFRAVRFNFFWYTIMVTLGSGSGHIGRSLSVTTSALTLQLGNEVRLPTPTPMPPTPTPATPTPATPTATPTPSPTPTPEPGVIIQLVVGGVGLAFLNKRRLRKHQKVKPTSLTSTRCRPPEPTVSK